MSKSTRRTATAARTPRLPREVLTAVQAAADKKAYDLVVLDLRKAAGFTDYFVIATGQSTRQIRTIADAVEERLRAIGSRPAHAEGRDTEWVLLDYFDFVVHVFSAETRAFYGLERLWGSATSIDLNPVLAPAGETRTG